MVKITLAALQKPIGESQNEGQGDQLHQSRSEIDGSW